MPTYEFEILDSQNGTPIGVVTLHRPVEARDRVEIRRKTAPRSIMICGVATPKLDQASEVLAGYRRAEEKMGSTREFHRSLGEFTPAQIKKAWNTPD
jgi:hypothetical protein